MKKEIREFIEILKEEAQDNVGFFIGVLVGMVVILLGIYVQTGKNFIEL